MLERIAVVDVLRAFALLGIVVTHAEMGFLAGPPPVQDFMQLNALDGAVHRFVGVFIESKFFSIFAFLFGLSFAIQLDRARQKGAAFGGRFAWRLIVLLFIGAAHQLLFNGDILMLYALLGLLLIPLGKVNTRVLFIVGLLLVLNVPGMVQGFAGIYAAPPTPEQQQANAEMSAMFMAKGQALYNTMHSGSLADIARVNFTDGLLMKSLFQVFSGRLWITFGCFLIGVCAWRAGLFEDSAGSRRFFRRLLVVGGAIAVVTIAITQTVQPSGPVSSAWLGLALDVQKVALASSYVAGVTLLYWRHSAGFLARLARMSMGPVEWLWRSATQFRWQPLGKPGVVAAG